MRNTAFFAPALNTIAALALMAACTASGGAQDTPKSLAGSSWRLVELQSNDDAIGVVRPSDPALYTMTLGTDGRVALRLDCNRASGNWQVPAPGQITFTPLAMTRALCPEGSLDTRVARELEYVRTYLLEGDRLRLIMMADGGTQLWMRTAP
jgi:heat shock protein HslJ